MTRSDLCRASIAAAGAMIFGTLLSACGQTNDFIGTWRKTSEVAGESGGELAVMIIDSATVECRDAQGKPTGPVASYKLVAPDEAVETGIFGMTAKLKLIDRNTMTTTSPDATFARA